MGGDATGKTAASTAATAGESNKYINPGFDSFARRLLR